MRATALFFRHSVIAGAITLFLAPFPLSQSARAETQHSIKIPASRLISALAELGRQSGSEIILRASGKGDIPVPAVRGRMSTQKAIEKMIRRHGLSVRQIAPHVYLVENARSAPSPPRISPRHQGADIDQPVLSQDFPTIMVSARRRPEYERDVPLMIRHYGPDILSTHAVRDISDIARITPGFMATGQTSNATPILVMRGQRRSISDENRIPLAVYVDEVPLPNQATLSPLFDLASIEVMRGPQGTVFGRNTTSGAIVIKTAQPGKDIPSYLEFDRGNYGLSRLEAAMEATILPGVSLRVTGQSLRRDGYSRLVSGEETDNANSDAMRAVILIAPTEKLRSTLSFDLFKADEKGAAQVLAGVYAEGGARTPVNAPYFDCGTNICDIDYYAERQQQLGKYVSQAGLPPLFHRNFKGISNITEYGDDDFLIRNIIGWRSTEMTLALDGDATPLPINDNITHINLRQWTEELQFQGKAGPIRYLLGVFYLDNAPAGAMIQQSAQYERPDNPASFISNYHYFKSAALFGQAVLPLTHALSAELGLRYTRETSRGCALRSRTLAPASYKECLSAQGSHARYRSGKLTWTASLSQKIGPQSLYITSRRAFRSGGYNTPRLGGALSSFQTFRPETLTDFEAGAKGQWRAGTISGQYAVAAYVGLYRNIQRPLFPPSDFDGDADISNDPITLYVNAARASIAGVDLDMAINIGSRTKMGFSAAYIDTRYTRVDAPDILRPLLGSNPITNRFSYTARLSGSAWITHIIPLAKHLGQVELSGDYSRNSDIRFAERPYDPFATQPGYGLFGASISWRRVGGKALDISLWGRNLTNQYYASGGGTLNPLYTTATLIPGPPRTFGLRLRYSFE